MTQIKISNLLDAIDKNGLPWGRYFAYDPATGSSCVLGQALINLGVPYSSPHELDKRVGNLNMKLKSIVFSETEGCGLGLIGFNDAKAQSYDEVKEYAHKILDPFKDEIVEY